MRICHIVPSLEARHGGPSKSVRTLANYLVHDGDSVELLATETPGDSLATATPDRATIHTFPRITPRRLARSPELFRYLERNRYDCIHHHSLWLLTLRYAHEAAGKSSTPLVISPRGMFSGWAYEHHRWRKRLAEISIHPGAFTSAAGWHATSPEEADDIKRLGFTQPVCVSPNGVAIPDAAQLGETRVAWETLCPAVRTRPVALFYSRFHRKKRLHELIDLWLAAPRGDWLLLIVGVSEDYSVAELTALVAAAGALEKIVIFDGTHRPPPYAVASLFLLPSHSENFGLVIAEALASGVPALVTDTTPWRALKSEECGWCVSWDNFSTALNAALEESLDTLHAKGQRGRGWMEREFSWEKAARLLREFYGSLKHEPS